MSRLEFDGIMQILIKGHKMKRLGLIFLSILFLATSASARECTAELEEKANDNLGMIVGKGWEGIYEYNQKYGPCVDGGLWEATSSSVVEMLSNKWDEFPILEKLVAKDNKFKLFIANNITATVGSDELLKIHKNATKHCPKRSFKLCKMIDREALISYKETLELRNN